MSIDGIKDTTESTATKRKAPDPVTTLVKNLGKARARPKDADPVLKLLGAEGKQGSKGRRRASGRQAPTQEAACNIAAHIVPNARLRHLYT